MQTFRTIPASIAVNIMAILAFTVFLALPQAAHAQEGELNLLTDLNTPFPPGCLAIDVPEQPAGDDNLLVDQLVQMPSINSASRDQPVLVQMWRVACADEGFSVVVVRLDPVNNDALVLVPQLFAGAGSVQNPFHEAADQTSGQRQSWCQRQHSAGFRLDLDAGRQPGCDRPERFIPV